MQCRLKYNGIILLRCNINKLVIVMLDFIVLFREEGLPFLFEPRAFACLAEDYDHAEEQCENAYPGCDIVWIYLCQSKNDSIESALNDWYSF